MLCDFEMTEMHGLYLGIVTDTSMKWRCTRVLDWTKYRLGENKTNDIYKDIFSEDILHYAQVTANGNDTFVIMKLPAIIN